MKPMLYVCCLMQLAACTPQIVLNVKMGNNPTGSSKLVVVSGNTQSGTVTNVLGRPLSVAVLAVDGASISNVGLSWAVANGDGVLSENVTVSNSVGVSTNELTLGQRAGLLSVSVKTLDDSASVSFSETALAGPATQFSFEFTLPFFAQTPMEFTVTARDAYQNVVTDYDGNVTLSDLADPSAVFPGPHTYDTSDAGVHTFANSILHLPGLHTVRAGDGTLSSTSASFSAASLCAASPQTFDLPTPCDDVGADSGFSPVTLLSVSAFTYY